MPRASPPGASLIPSGHTRRSRASSTWRRGFLRRRPRDWPGWGTASSAGRRGTGARGRSAGSWWGRAGRSWRGLTPGAGLTPSAGKGALRFGGNRDSRGRSCPGAHRFLFDHQREPGGEGGQDGRGDEGPGVAARPVEDPPADRGPQGGAHLVGEENPARELSDRVAPEDVRRQRRGGRDGRDVVEPEEGGEEMERGDVPDVEQEEKREAADEVVEGQRPLPAEPVADPA